MRRLPLLPAGLLAAALLAAAVLALMTAPTMAMAAASPSLSPDQVRTLLGGEGYTDVSNLSERDGALTADANRYGVHLTGVRIDPVTGEVLDAPMLTAAQAGTLLAAKGYTAISNVHLTTNEAGSIIEADATSGGQVGTWSIDPWSGAVYPATDLY